MKIGFGILPLSLSPSPSPSLYNVRTYVQRTPRYGRGSLLSLSFKWKWDREELSLGKKTIYGTFNGSTCQVLWLCVNKNPFQLALKKPSFRYLWNYENRLWPTTVNTRLPHNKNLTWSTRPTCFVVASLVVAVVVVVVVVVVVQAKWDNLILSVIYAQNKLFFPAATCIKLLFLQERKTEGQSQIVFLLRSYSHFILPSEISPHKTSKQTREIYWTHCILVRLTLHTRMMNACPKWSNDYVQFKAAEQLIGTKFT